MEMAEHWQFSYNVLMWEQQYNRFVEIHQSNNVRQECYLACLFRQGSFSVISMGININLYTPRQKGRHFADDIFKYIFVNEKILYLIKILPNFVPKGPIYNNPVLA